MKKFDGVFELFDIDVKRSMQGNKLVLTFKADENKAIEKKLIDWRDEWAEVSIRQKLPQESVGEIITVKDKFQVKDIRVRNSKNGNNLFLYVERPYEKVKEVEIVELRFQEVVIDMIPTEPELFQNAQSEVDDDIGFEND